MNLKDNLKKIRKDYNLSQEQLAEKLGVSRQAVSKWEAGQAYPEMDKVLQLCQMFNLNIDDLLNQDIREINDKKQSRNNINKYIDDFFDYITKTVDMFSSLNFKSKIKCIFEQVAVAGIIALVLTIIGAVATGVLDDILMVLPDKIYYSVSYILKDLYVLVALILGIIVLLHIFKIRYLDYFVIVRDDNNIDKEGITKDNNDIVDDSDVKVINRKDKISLEKSKEKIIIRDPKHAGYKFLSGLFKCIIFFLKIMAIFIALGFIGSLIGLVIGLVISFLFVKAGLIFIGVLLTLIALIIINLIILVVIYNFIMSRKGKRNRLALIFLGSLIKIGVGVGLMIIDIPNFNYIDDFNSNYYVDEIKEIDMNDELVINNYYGDIEYVESNNSNIKIVYRHSSFYKASIEKYDNYVYLYCIPGDNKIMDMVRETIKDINDKRIVEYDNFDVKIYTNKDNIEKLKDNYNKY